MGLFGIGSRPESDCPHGNNAVSGLSSSARHGSSGYGGGFTRG